MTELTNLWLFAQVLAWAAVITGIIPMIILVSVYDRWKRVPVRRRNLYYMPKRKARIA